MKKYPKIEYIKDIIGRESIIFDKLDGSNLRFEWNNKKGWFKFGTRNNLMDRNYPEFGEGIDIFLNKYGDTIPKIFIDKYKKVESFVVFGEFFGKNSFAGSHLKDDKKDVVIFDINAYKRGFLPPSEFIKNFSHLEIPRIVHQGKITEDIIRSIKNNTLGLNEGVVVKGEIGKDIWVTKIKTQDWLRRLKIKFNESELNSIFKDDISNT